VAKQVLTNVNVTLAGTDISSYVKAITLTTKADSVETTTFGTTGNARTRVSGLIDNSVKVDLFQDYSAVEGLIYPLVGGTAVTMVVKPNGTGTASTANPQYSFTPLVTEWNPVAGAVGDVATVSVTWGVSGAIVKTP
jgi:hypothetical protein